MTKADTRSFVYKAMKEFLALEVEAGSKKFDDALTEWMLRGGRVAVGDSVQLSFTCMADTPKEIEREQTMLELAASVMDLDAQLTQLQTDQEAWNEAVKCWQ